jgi:hypothetical protein
VQSALTVQVVLHWLVPQVYGAQPTFITDWQVPEPLQVRFGV